MPLDQAADTHATAAAETSAATAAAIDLDILTLFALLPVHISPDLSVIDVSAGPSGHAPQHGTKRLEWHHPIA
jgi:hypothetical protein